MNQLDFAGRTAVVTGGVQGIGAAIAKRLQASGAKVAIWDLDGKPRVDVADQASIDAALKRTLNELGRIDVLINNAGIGTAVPALRETPDEFRSVIDVNLMGSYWMAQACARVMEPVGQTPRRASGRITAPRLACAQNSNPRCRALS